MSKWLSGFGLLAWFGAAVAGYMFSGTGPGNGLGGALVFFVLLGLGALALAASAVATLLS